MLIPILCQCQYCVRTIVEVRITILFDGLIGELVFLCHHYNKQFWIIHHYFEVMMQILNFILANHIG